MNDDKAVERGPNYDWRHEAIHYKLECEKLRELLRKVERSSDEAHAELSLIQSERAAELISNTKAVYNGTQVMELYTEMAAKLGSAQKTLEWYGDGNNHIIARSDNRLATLNDCSPVHIDGGRRARHVLSKLSSEHSSARQPMPEPGHAPGCGCNDCYVKGYFEKECIGDDKDPQLCPMHRKQSGTEPKV